MEYLNFTFDGISSSVFNLIIQNNGEDLSFPSQPGFENKIVSPLYQGTSFLAGVNKTSRVFNFNCWADSITKEEVDVMLRWLNPDKIGKLHLDYNPGFHYKVKINAISDFKHMAINSDNTSNYEFNLSFITVGDFASISNTKYSSLDVLASNFPKIKVVGADFYVYNYFNLPIFLNFDIIAIDEFSVLKNDEIWYMYDLDGSCVIDSRHGFVLVANQLIEANYEGLFTNKGVLDVPPGTRTIFGTVTKPANDLVLSTISGLTDHTVIAEVGAAVSYNSTNYQAIATGKKEGEVVVLNVTEPTKITGYGVAKIEFNYRNMF